MAAGLVCTGVVLDEWGLGLVGTHAFASGTAREGRKAPVHHTTDSARAPGQAKCRARGNTPMKTAFGDLVLDWRGTRMRRGSERWIPLHEDTADILEQLIIMDEHRLSGETLWRAVVGKAAFDGSLMSQMIHNANSALAEVDCELLVTDFSVRLVDVTPRPFLQTRIAASNKPNAGAKR
jgi:hypothetical protein